MGHVISLDMCEICGEVCAPGEKYCKKNKKEYESENRLDDGGSFLEDATKKEEDEFV